METDLRAPKLLIYTDMTKKFTQQQQTHNQVITSSSAFSPITQRALPTAAAAAERRQRVHEREQRLVETERRLIAENHAHPLLLAPLLLPPPPPPVSFSHHAPQGIANAAAAAADGVLESDIALFESLANVMTSKTTIMTERQCERLQRVLACLVSNIQLAHPSKFYTLSACCITNSKLLAVKLKSEYTETINQLQKQHELSTAELNRSIEKAELGWRRANEIVERLEKQGEENRQKFAEIKSSFQDRLDRKLKEFELQQTLLQLKCKQLETALLDQAKAFSSSMSTAPITKTSTVPTPSSSISVSASPSSSHLSNITTVITSSSQLPPNGPFTLSSSPSPQTTTTVNNNNNNDDEDDSYTTTTNLQIVEERADADSEDDEDDKTIDCDSPTQQRKRQVWFLCGKCKKQKCNQIRFYNSMQMCYTCYKEVALPEIIDRMKTKKLMHKAAVERLERGKKSVTLQSSSSSSPPPTGKKARINE